MHIFHNVKVFLSQSQHPALRIKPRAGEEMGFIFTLKQTFKLYWLEYITCLFFCCCCDITAFLPHQSQCKTRLHTTLNKTQHGCSKQIVLCLITVHLSSHSVSVSNVTHWLQKCMTQNNEFHFNSPTDSPQISYISLSKLGGKCRTEIASQTQIFNVWKLQSKVSRPSIKWKKKAIASRTEKK